MKRPSIALTKEGGFTFLTHTPPETNLARVFLSAPMPVPHNFSRLELSFLCGMLERGSAHYSKDEYEEGLESLGAQVHTAADGALFSLSLTVPIPALKAALRIVHDALSEPRFSEEEIRKLKKEYLQLLHEEEDDTRALAYSAFTRILYTPSEEGYTPSLSSQRKGLSRITKATLRAIHHALLHAPWYVSTSGNADTHEAIRIFCASIRQPVNSDPQIQLQPPALAESHTQLIPVRDKQNIEFCIGNRLPLTCTDEAFRAFAFGLDVLGKRGGFAGRLMKTVREKEGLTYSIYAGIRNVTAATYGHWHISTFFTPHDTPRGIASTKREIERITRGISSAEHTRFQELLTNQFSLVHESVASTLALYHYGLSSGRSQEDIECYPDHIRSLSRTRINEALRAHLSPDHLVVVGAGPTTKLPPFEKK